MYIWGIHIPAIAVALAVFASVYRVFAVVEDDLQSEEQRRFVSDWLLGVRTPNERWRSFVLDVFAGLFGKRHWSIRCMWRSFALTVALLIVVGGVHLLASGLLAETLEFTRDHLRLEGTFVGLFVLMVCVGDYLSLWKTRFLLTRVAASKTGLYTVGYVVGDFLITTVAAVGVRLVFFILLIAMVVPASRILDAISAIFSHPDLLHLLRSMVLDKETILYFLVAYLTSAWLWAYLIAVQLTRMLGLVPSLVTSLSNIVDIPRHPTRILGVFAALLLAVGVYLFQIINT